MLLLQAWVWHLLLSSGLLSREHWWSGSDWWRELCNTKKGKNLKRSGGRQGKGIMWGVWWPGPGGPGTWPASALSLHHTAGQSQTTNTMRGSHCIHYLLVAMAPASKVPPEFEIKKGGIISIIFWRLGTYNRFYLGQGSELQCPSACGFSAWLQPSPLQETCLLLLPPPQVAEQEDQGPGSHWPPLDSCGKSRGDGGTEDWRSNKFTPLLAASSSFASSLGSWWWHWSSSQTSSWRSIFGVRVQFLESRAQCVISSGKRSEVSSIKCSDYSF